MGIETWTCPKQNASSAITKVLEHQALRNPRRSPRRPGMANIDIERRIKAPDVIVGHHKVDRTGNQFSHAGVLEYPLTVAFLTRACNWDHAQFAERLQTGMYRA
jgi:hypothetical protein